MILKVCIIMYFPAIIQMKNNTPTLIRRLLREEVFLDCRAREGCWGSTNCYLYHFFKNLKKHTVVCTFSMTWEALMPFMLMSEVKDMESEVLKPL